MKLQIGELANLFGITTKALRHYEKLGLLRPERDVNGYRLYDANHVLQVQRIRQLQGLGLSLRQIGLIVQEDAEGDFWKSVLHSLLEQTESEIEVLEARREQLSQLIDTDSAETFLTPTVPQNSAIDTFLEQHLSPTMQLQWRRDPSVYALVGSLLRRKRVALQGSPLPHEFVGWISAEQQPVGIPQNLFAMQQTASVPRI